MKQLLVVHTLKTGEKTRGPLDWFVVQKATPEADMVCKKKKKKKKRMFLEPLMSVFYGSKYCLV